jgi:hypothetical protein
MSSRTTSDKPPDKPSPRWAYLGEPCPDCVWTEPHLHSLRHDGTLGLVVRRLDDGEGVSDEH